MESLATLFYQARPYLLGIFLQVGNSVMSILAMLAMKKGMSPYVLVVQRMVVASLLLAPFALVFERNSRPKMTLWIFAKIALMSFFEPVLDQTMFYTGMKITSPTYVVAMSNILPAITFLMAWIFRFEKVGFRRLQFQAKVVGTLVSIGGAMLLTFVHGPILYLPWTKGSSSSEQQSPHHTDIQDLMKGGVAILFGCVSWSSFIIMQAIILKSYPAKLSLTALMCMLGAVESTILTMAVERGNRAIWFIHWDVRILAAVYGGIFSGASYYVVGSVAKEKGPVFVSSFNPLSMVMVAILGSFVFKERMYLGRVIGAIVIVLGLYLVLWGKSRDRTPKSTSSRVVTPCGQTASTEGHEETSHHDHFVACNDNGTRPTMEPV